jgi:hypothetical protein
MFHAREAREQYIMSYTVQLADAAKVSRRLGVGEDFRSANNSCGWC